MRLQLQILPSQHLESSVPFVADDHAQLLRKGAALVEGFSIQCRANDGIAAFGKRAGGLRRIRHGAHGHAEHAAKAIPVESGTVISTRIKVFFRACRK